MVRGVVDSDWDACRRSFGEAAFREGLLLRMTRSQATTRVLSTWAAQLFVSIGRLSARLPHFRGRTRAFLLLYRALGLEGKHLLLETTLRHPVPFRVRLDIHSWLQRIAFLTGGYEADTVEFLLRLHRTYRRGGALLDVGANVGLITIPAALLLAREGTDERGGAVAVGVEAVPANARALTENVRMSGTGQLVRVVEAALGEVAKTVDIQVEGNLQAGEGSGTANILAEGSTYECVRIPLQVTTIDSLAAEGRLLSPCSVVKIDTDGYDLKVLQGAEVFLRRERPVIFGEFSAHCMRWHGQSIDDVVALARRLSYEVWPRVNGGRWAFSREVGRESFDQDLLLVPSEAVSRFEWCLGSEGERPRS